jgi:hypothetical protein
MDWTAIVEAVAIPLGAVGTIVWYGYTKLIARMGAVEQRQGAFELFAARTYVTSHTLETAITNFNDSVKAIFKKLDTIYEKLDKKADKA